MNESDERMTKIHILYSMLDKLTQDKRYISQSIYRRFIPFYKNELKIINESIIEINSTLKKYISSNCNIKFAKEEIKTPEIFPEFTVDKIAGKGITRKERFLRVGK